VDPCEAHNAVTLAALSAWPTEIWITESVAFTIDPASDLSHVTTPAGADCGAYTVDLSLTDASGNAAPGTATITIDTYSITINFNHDTSTVGNWDIYVTAYNTNYPDITAPGTNAAASTTFTFAAKDPCAETTGTTIAIDSTQVAANWPTT